MKYLIFLIIICSGGAATAQITFSLSDCIKYTLNNHNSIKVYDNNIAIAKAQSAQALAAYLPNVNGSANFTDNLKLPSTVLPAGLISSQPITVQFGTRYNSDFGVDVSQTLFDYSKLVAIKANKPYAEMTELQKQQNKETLMYNTATAYFQVLIYKEQLRLLEVNKNKYDEMVKVLEYQYSKGTVLEKDVDRVKVNLNSTIYQIEDAKTKEELALNTLKNAMGMDRDTTLVIAGNINYESLALIPLQSDFDLNNLTENKINTLSVTLQEYSVMSKQASQLPTFTTVGKWGNQVLNKTFSDAFSDWKSYSYIGVSMNIPLFSGFKTRNEIKEEKLKLDNEKLNFKINQQDLKLNYDNARSAVATAFSNYESNRDNMSLANKVLSVTDYQYQRGAANLTDYLNDDAGYKATQTNYINSLYNLMISQLSYQKSQGKLSEFINKIK
jgi:outer membrane protein TolC